MAGIVIEIATGIADRRGARKEEALFMCCLFTFVFFRGCV